MDTDLAGPAARAFYGTFMALVLGWFVGRCGDTRLFCLRYRSVKSQAYNQPLRMRSFRDVTQLGMIWLSCRWKWTHLLSVSNLGEAKIGSELHSCGVPYPVSGGSHISQGRGYYFTH